MQKKDTIHILEDLINEKQQLEDLELRVQEIRSTCTKNPEKKLLQQLEIRIKDGKFYQQKLKALVDNVINGELDEEHIEEFKVVVDSLRQSTTVEFAEVRQLDAIKQLPTWVQSLHQFFHGAQKETFQQMIQGINSSCDKLDATSLTDQQYHTLKDWTGKMPQILDINLKALSEKVRLIVWINEAFSLMKKQTITLSELERLFSEALTESQAAPFKELQHKFNHVKAGLESLYQDSVSWLAKSKDLDDVLEKVKNMEEILQSGDSTKHKAIVDFKEQCTQLLQSAAENSQKVEDVKIKYAKLEQASHSIAWVFDCYEYLQSKDRQHISDITTLHKRGLELRLGNQWTMMNRISELFQKTQGFLLRYDEFQRAIDKNDDQSRMETEDPYYKYFQLTKGKLPLEEVITLFKELNSSNQVIALDKIMEKIHPELQKCNDYWIHFQKIHEIYEEKLINLSLLENWKNEDSMMRLIGLEINEMNKRLINIPFNLGKQEKDILRFQWIYFTLAINSGFLKKPVEFWKESLKVSKNFDNPIKEFEEKLANEIFNIQKIESAYEELKQSEKLSKDKRTKEASTLRTFSDILSLNRSIALCNIDNTTISAYVQSSIDRAETLKSEYKLNFSSKRKHPLKDYREMLEKIRSSLKNFTLEQEFVIEEIINDAEDIVRTIKNLKQKNDFESKKKIIETINRYKAQRVENLDAEQLVKEISMSEDALSPFELRLFDLETELDFDETMEIKRKIDKLRDKFPQERILRIEAEMFIRKIRLLQKYWEEGGSVYGVTLDGIRVYLDLAQEYQPIKATKERLDRAIQFIKIIISDCEEKLSEYKAKKVEVLEQIINSGNCYLGFVNLSDEIEKIISKKAPTYRKQPSIPSPVQYEEDNSKGYKSTNFGRSRGASEDSQRRVKGKLGQSTFTLTSNPIDSSSEEELQAKKLQEIKNKELLNQKIQAQSQIVNRLVKAIENNNFYQTSMKIDSIVDVAKRLCDKIFKNNSERIFQSHMMSKQIRKLIERLTDFEDISQRIFEEKFSYKSLLKYINSNEDTLSDENQRLSFEFYMDDKLISQDNYVIKKKATVQKLPSTVVKDRLFDFDDMTLPSSLAQQIQREKSLDKYTAFDEETIEQKQKLSSNYNTGSETYKQSVSSTYSMTNPQSGHIDQRNSTKRYTYSQFSDDEDEVGNKEGHKLNQPIDETAIQNISEFRESIRKTREIQDEQSEDLAIMYDPEEPETQRRSVTQSQTTYSLFEGGISFKDQEISNVLLLSNNPHKIINQIPVFLHKTIQLEGMIQVESFDDYLEKSLINNSDNEKKRKVFVSGWFESTESQEDLDSLAGQLYESERVAVFQWHQDCKIYAFNSKDLSHKSRDLLKSRKTAAPDSNQLMFIYIFKERFDQIYTERLKPTVFSSTGKLVPDSSVVNENKSEIQEEMVLIKSTDENKTTSKQTDNDDLVQQIINKYNNPENTNGETEGKEKSMETEQDSNQVNTKDFRNQYYQKREFTPGIKIIDYEYQKSFARHHETKQNPDNSILELLVDEDSYEQDFRSQSFEQRNFQQNNYNKFQHPTNRFTPRRDNSVQKYDFSRSDSVTQFDNNISTNSSSTTRQNFAEPSKKFDRFRDVSTNSNRYSDYNNNEGQFSRESSTFNQDRQPNTFDSTSRFNQTEFEKPREKRDSSFSTQKTSEDFGSALDNQKHAFKGFNNNSEKSNDRFSRSSSLAKDRSRQNSRSNTPSRQYSQQSQGENKLDGNLNEILQNLNNALGLLVNQNEVTASAPKVFTPAPPVNNYQMDSNSSHDYYNSGSMYNTGGMTPNPYSYGYNQGPPAPPMNYNHYQAPQTPSYDVINLLQQQQQQINLLQQQTLEKESTQKSTTKQNFSKTFSRDQSLDNRKQYNGYTNNQYNSNNSYRENQVFESKNDRFINQNGTNNNNNKFSIKQDFDSNKNFYNNNDSQNSNASGFNQYNSNSIKIQQDNKEVMKAVDQLRNIQQKFSQPQPQPSFENEKTPISSSNHMSALNKLKELNDMGPQTPKDQEGISSTFKYSVESKSQPQNTNITSFNSSNTNYTGSTFKNSESSGSISTSQLGSLIQAQQRHYASMNETSTAPSSQYNHDKSSFPSNSISQFNSKMSAQIQNNNFNNNTNGFNNNNNNNYNFNNNNNNSNTSLSMTQVQINDSTNRNTIGQTSFTDSQTSSKQYTSVNDLTQFFANSQTMMPNTIFNQNEFKSTTNNRASDGVDYQKPSAFKYSTTKSIR